jgi:hypothetical protein
MDKISESDMNDEDRYVHGEGDLGVGCFLLSFLYMTEVTYQIH